MEIPISVGEWMNALLTRMTSASDGDCFCLPTHMHVHAFFLIKEAHFPNKDFKIKVATGDLVNV